MSVSVMKKLTVLASVRDADRLVRRLMRLRCAELRAVPLGDLPDGGTLLRYNSDRDRAEAERRVADVTAALPILDAYTVKTRSWNTKPITVSAREFSASGRMEDARAMVSEVLEIRDGQVTCQNEYNRLEALCRSLTPWMEYTQPLEGVETDLCEVWLGTLPGNTLISRAEDALASLHAGVEEICRDKKAAYVSVLLLKEDSDAVARGLASLGFVRSSFKGLPVKGTAVENHRICLRRLDELDNQLQVYGDRLRVLSDSLPELQVLYDMEMTTLTAARERQKLATTEHCAVLEGWVPADREEKVSAALDKLPCAYGMEDPAPGEEPPVLLKNNGFATNFEWVVGMYSYPKYGTYDPTFIMSIYYFVIFGLMFADVGYGLLIMLGGFLGPKLVKLSPGMKRMLTMFGYCGIACTVLGAVFGGWFGDLPYAIMTSYMGYESTEAAQAAAPWFNGVTLTLNGEPLSLNPLVNPIPFLIISLAMGMIHIVGGMAVKFCLLCKEGKVFSAIFDIGSYWILFAGLGVLFVNKTVGLWMTVGGAALIVLTHGRDKKNIFAKLLFGLKGLYDLISYASDLLSYSRILALGLAAGVMAQVFNLLATLGGVSIPGFILLVFVMLVGHGLNIAINLLGSFVHACRLQYLEFFSKFYEDGGVPFAPALPSDKYSTAEDTAVEDAEPPEAH
ncbi:MAG: V-type ATP synthase subunit I [Clostridia bacterium]|nr:V-type ATP synthase subunit I [Clostridia bacterium]